MKAPVFMTVMLGAATLAAMGLAIVSSQSTGLAAPGAGKPAASTGKEASPAEAPWSRQCVKSPDGAKEACFVQQFITAMPQNVVLLKVVFGYLAPDGKPRVIVTAPLGVLLQAGLTMTINGQSPMSVPFEDCKNGGCRAVIDMDNQALDQFRNGRQLTVTYLTEDRKAMDLPVRLDGLAAALKTVAP